MNFSNTFLLAACIAVAAKAMVWIWQLRSRNAGLVDAVWAWTLGSLALVYALFGMADPQLRLLLAVMGGVWGLRLGWHLWRRNHGQPEDWRYARFREDWGRRADRNMFWFFQFQNLFTLMLSAAAFAPIAFRPDMPARGALIAAGTIWLLAVIGEATADAQMARFRADPASRGRVCRRGLWRYSRHPNYFFECLHWVAYVPLAWGAPWGWVSLAAPAVVAFLLMRLSGVPLLEAELIRRKRGYADYVRTTSALIPWPPRHS